MLHQEIGAVFFGSDRVRRGFRHTLHDLHVGDIEFVAAGSGSAAFIEQVGGPEKLARAYPLGRLGEPADIAGAVLFLASPLSSWITGQVLSVSGGYTMV